MAVSKSWLGPSISDTEVFLPGYSIYRSDHSRFGGGIAVYVADHPSMSPLSCGAPCGEVESLWLSISSSSFFFFAFGCMYRPPSAPFTSVSHLCSILESLLLSHKHVVACGDLNIDISDSIHPFTKSLQNFITYHSMFAQFSQPTRISEIRCSMLDHFLTSSPTPLFSTFPFLISYPLSPSLIDLSLTRPSNPSPDVLSRSLTLLHSTKTLLLCSGFSLACLMMLRTRFFTFNSLFSGVLNCHAPMTTLV